MTETERAAIEAIRRYAPERIVTSQEGHAMTVGRLCELALSETPQPPASEASIRPATPAEALEVLHARLSEHLSPAEHCELMAAIAALRSNGGSAKVPE